MRKTEFKNILSSYIEREEKYQAEHNEIIEIFKPLVMKPINKRTLNQKVLGDKFKFVERYGMFYIIGEYQHLIGYKGSEDIISIDKIEGVSRGFKELDACHGYASVNRVEQAINIDFDKAFKIFNEIDKAFKKLQTLFGDIEREKLGSFHFPPYYEILKSISPNEDHIKLYNFYYLRK